MFRKGHRLFSVASIGLILVAVLHAIGHFSSPPNDLVMAALLTAMQAYRFDFALGSPSMLDIFESLSLTFSIMLVWAVLGGILIGLIEAFGAGYMGDLTNVCFLDQWLPGFTAMCEANSNGSLFGSNYKDVFAFIVLILVLVFRPSGLLGERVGDRA